VITSQDNEKLKTVRKLRLKKHREALGLFVTEGEDLMSAGLAAGLEPRALLVHPDSGLEGEPVEPALLDGVSALGSGSRVIGIWPVVWAGAAAGAAKHGRAEGEGGAAGAIGGPCIFLDAVSDPGNVGTILRTVDALIDATVVLGPGTADPFSPNAVRASMGSIFSQPVARAGIGQTPAPRIAMVAQGGSRPGSLDGTFTVCLGSEREGVSAEVLKHCEESWTIPLRAEGPESLNVAAAAAIACERISSPAPADAGQAGAVGAGQAGQAAE
jgi:TrmH family RNA methyltransferase